MREIERIDPLEKMIERDALALVAERDARAAAHGVKPHNSVVLSTRRTTTT